MNQKELICETPYNDSIDKKEEYKECRNRLIDQIKNMSETVLMGLSKIEDQFKNSYENYLVDFFNKVDYYIDFIEKNILEVNKRNICYNEINSLLSQMLKDNLDLYQNYEIEIVNITQALLDNYYGNNFFKKIVDFINSIILKQNEETTKEALTKKEELKEEKKNEVRTFPKNKNIEKLVINGENDINSILNDIQSSSDLNYNKIIIKKITKENFESLFSQSNPIYQKLHKKPESDINKYNNSETPDEITPIIEDDKITDLVIKDSNLEEINFEENFPYIDNLKIINSKISYNLFEKLKYNKLISLKLENVGLINENFNILFEQLRKKEIMRKNLREFSVKKNYITFLDYKKSYADNILKSMRFNSLEILDMSYNKIYLFQNQIFNCLDNIKVINLSNNDIAFPTSLTDLLKSAKYKKCLVLMTNNLAILKERANIEYNKYLIEILPEINYPLKNISLANLFCSNNFDYIFKINLSNFRDSLTYLNLSNSQFNDNNLISLLNQQFYFPNIKSLILESNYLTENFLYSMIKKEYNFDKKLLKLKLLNLSENKINCSNVEKFKQFFQAFKNLEILELKHTPMEICINQYLKKKVVNDHDQKTSKGPEHNYTEEEKKIQLVIDNDNFLSGVTNIIILDLNKIDYSKYIKTYFPRISNKLNMESNFPLKN